METGTKSFGGDEDSSPGATTPQTVEPILEADLVAADLAGFNPNV